MAESDSTEHATQTQPAPNPWVVGGVAFGLGSAFMLLARTHEPIPAAATVAGLLVLLMAGGLFFWRLSHRAGWSVRHELGVAGGLLLTYAWYGFVQRPSAGSASSQIDLVGNVIFALGAFVLLVIAMRRTASMSPIE